MRPLNAAHGQAFGEITRDSDVKQRLSLVFKWMTEPQDWAHYSVELNATILCSVTVHAFGPTLHHEDDIRVQRRIEEIYKSLGPELSCPGTRRVSGALSTHTAWGRSRKTWTERGGVNIPLLGVRYDLPEAFPFCASTSPSQWNTNGLSASLT